MSQAEVLKEYLLAVGYKIDETSSRRFDDSIRRLDLGAMALGKRLLGVGVAAQALVAVFARSMERLYYASKRTDSTVANIQALEYAGRQLGISGGEMTAALESMSRAMRANPGLTGLLKDLGVQVSGRDKSDVLADLVTQLTKMPFYVAQQYASLFGIEPDQLFMIQQQIEAFQRLREERRKLGEAAGIDADKAAAAAKDYANALRQVEERLGLLKDIIAVQLLPTFMKMTDQIIRGLDALNQWLGRWSSVSPQQQLSQGAEAAKSGIGKYWDFTKKFWSGMFGGGQIAPGSTITPSPASTPSGSLFSRLEGQYGLPSGLLDKMWKKESNRGDPRFMRSHAGALGHFQFMPGTAKEMGLADPFDLAQSAEAASRYMQTLLRRYNGDQQKALAAYNWGMGNVDRKGLAQAPWETRDYVATISGQPIRIEQTNVFHIASPDPEAAGRSAARQLGSANADLTRNMGAIIK